MLGVGMTIAKTGAKRLIFDTRAVTSAMGKRERRFLASFGAFTRITARRSIRKRKAISLPGNPPSSHTGTHRSGIFFAPDESRRSVVIGPERVQTSPSGRPRRGTKPEVLEYGGEIAIEEVQSFDGSFWWQPSQKFLDETDRPTRTRYAQVAARPSMGPAFEKAKAQQARFWRTASKT